MEGGKVNGIKVLWSIVESLVFEKLSGGVHGRLYPKGGITKQMKRVLTRPVSWVSVDVSSFRSILFGFNKRKMLYSESLYRHGRKRCVTQRC